MNETDRINLSLRQFGEAWDTQIELGPDGACVLEFEEHLMVTIRHQAECSRLHVQADLLDLHADHRPGVYKMALTLACGVFDETGVAVGLDDEANVLTARSRIDLANQDPDQLVEFIAESLLVAKALHNRLQVGHEHSDVDGTELHQAVLGSGFVKV